MEQADFVRLVTELPGKLSWFLGAGASQSAGLPTAVDLIWDLKRRFYCSEEHQDVSSNDLQNAAVRAKIDAFMVARGFPKTSEPSAYSRSFELIFGSDYDRQRRYLSAVLSEKDSAPALGHRVFAALIAMGVTKTVFTTNFDTVVERALANVGSQAISPFHIEGSYAALKALNNDDFPIYCKLHGDFRFESLKNLENDLRTQDIELGRSFIAACNRFGVVVAGYSGRDESVIDLFKSALDGQNPFPHGIYWTGMKGRPALPAVSSLLDTANKKGIRAEYIEIETFDSLMSRIWKQTPDKPAQLVDKIGRSTSRPVSINLPLPGSGSILRLNALPITELPTTAVELTFQKAMEWEYLQKAEAKAKGEIICTKGLAIWAWGNEEALRTAFGADLREITEVPITERLADIEGNWHLKKFIEQALGRGLARGKPLLYRSSRAGSVLILDRNARPSDATKAIRECVETLHGQIPGLMTIPSDEHPQSESVWWAESVRLDVNEINGAYWLVLKPDIWIWPRHARRQAADFIDKRVGNRFNQKADQLLSAWITLLLPDAEKGTDQLVRPFEGPSDAHRPAFRINARTAFSRKIAL